jgi:hypothetical protein
VVLYTATWKKEMDLEETVRQRFSEFVASLCEPQSLETSGHTFFAQFSQLAVCVPSLRSACVRFAVFIPVLIGCRYGTALRPSEISQLSSQQ